MECTLNLANFMKYIQNIIYNFKFQKQKKKFLVINFDLIWACTCLILVCNVL